MRLVVAAVAVAAALAAGLFLGWAARRRADHARLPARPDRPRAIDIALRAWADGDRPKLLASAADARGQADALGPEARAELRFLEAILSGERRLLGTVAEEEGRWPAGARARWILIRRTRNPETQTAMRAAFADAYPDAWVLEDERRPGGS